MSLWLGVDWCDFLSVLFTPSLNLHLPKGIVYSHFLSILSAPTFCQRSNCDFQLTDASVNPGQAMMTVVFSLAQVHEYYSVLIKELEGVQKYVRFIDASIIDVGVG